MKKLIISLKNKRDLNILEIHPFETK